MDYYDEHDESADTIDQRLKDNEVKKKERNLSATKVMLLVVITSMIISVICCLAVVKVNSKYIRSTENHGKVKDHEHIISIQQEDDEAVKEVSVSNIYDCVVNVSVKSPGSFLSQSTTVCSGNGVLISDDGIILTSAYMLETEGDIVVVDSYGQEYDAEIIGTDYDSYIAVLKIIKNDCKYAKIGDSSRVCVGDRVLCIGNRLSSDFSNPVTFGTISGYDSNIVLKDGTVVNIFQTDATSMASSIGGLLFNLDGQLIGITTAKYTISSTDLGLVTPINDLVESIDVMLGKKAESDNLKLGISGTDEDYGVNVDDVAKESLAEKAGIVRGDLVVKVNGIPVHSLSEIVKIRNNVNIGDELIFTIYRNGELMECKVTN